MTQPTSVDMTFDTSLIDLKPDSTSFSTTESEHSEKGPSQSTIKDSSLQQGTTQANQTPTRSPAPSIQCSLSPGGIVIKGARAPHGTSYVPTQDAYNQWASVYDTDGNMLQSIDNLELAMLLPELFTHVSTSFPQLTNISLLDLACGTGRSTALAIPCLPEAYKANVTCLDFSQGMLDVAVSKLGPLAAQTNGRVSVRLECTDCFPTMSHPPSSPLPSVPHLAQQHILLSTLVLEHIPLPSFFATLFSLLLPYGIALVTNMHADMGRVSQAGFVNGEGVKIRPTSFTYTVDETVNEARRAGLEVLNVKERGVREEDVELGTVGERGRKWVGVRVWYGVVVRRMR